MLRRTSCGGRFCEIIGDYDLVLITGKELEHVWEQHECTSGDIREITIQFSPDLFFGNVVNKNQFDSIRRMLERAQCGLSFPMQAIMKVYNWLDPPPLSWLPRSRLLCRDELSPYPLRTFPL